MNLGCRLSIAVASCRIASAQSWWHLGTNYWEAVIRAYISITSIRTRNDIIPELASIIRSNNHVISIQIWLPMCMFSYNCACLCMSTMRLFRFNCLFDTTKITSCLVCRSLHYYLQIVGPTFAFQSHTVQLP